MDFPTSAAALRDQPGSFIVQEFGSRVKFGQYVSLRRPDGSFWSQLNPATLNQLIREKHATEILPYGGADFRRYSGTNSV